MKLSALITLVLVVALVSTSLTPANMPQASHVRYSSPFVNKHASNIKWSSCDGRPYDFYEVVDVEVIGNLVFGQSVTITGKSKIMKPFTIYGAHVTASISGITIFSGIIRPDHPEDFNVGPAEYSITRRAPFTPLSGNYKVVAKALGEGDAEFECYVVSATVS